jgi:predicted alpha/beta hydrolase family esterase
MTNIIIIHGSYGSPDENWFPWVKRELERYGHTVYVPKFPTPDNQGLSTWKLAFEEYNQYVTEDTIFVGHSLGPAFILRLLEKTNITVKACFFVSPFIELLNNPEFDEINKTFLRAEFDWKTILEHSTKFTVFHSDNDPYVPLAYAQNVAKNCNTEVTIIPNGRHLNSDAGYNTFSKLLHMIKKEL